VTGQWDEVRLDQVFVNLVSNAIKYGSRTTIDVSVTQPTENTARIIVRDRGIGIAMEDQSRIFQRFERAVSSRNYSGFGLGLWIVQRIVEAHGGEIHVESAPGCGATFTVDLLRKPLASH
jgi:signal transduction histidine kinase